MPTSNVDIVLRARDEATAKLKSVTGAMEGLAGTISRMSFAMGTGGAVAAGLMAASVAATGLVLKYVDVAESIDKIRAVTGVSAANIQIFRKAVEQAGGTADEADNALKNMGEAIQRQDPLLRRVGASGLSTWNAMMKVSDAMERTAAGAGRGSAAMDLLGKKSDAAIAVLANGSRSLAAFGDNVHRVGAVMSDEAIDRFARADTLIEQLRLTFEALQLQLATVFVPVLIKILELFANLQLQAASMVPTLMTLIRAFMVMHNFATDPFNTKKERGGLLAEMGAEAVRMATALAAANRQWEEMKRLVEALRSAKPGPTLDKADVISDEELKRRVRERARTIDQGPGMFHEGLFGVPGFAQPTFEDLPGKRGGGFRPKLKIGPMLDEAKTHLTTFSEHMEAVAATIIQSFEIIGDSVHRSLVDVMMNLTNRMQTFRSAIVSIFQAVRDGILRALAEIIDSSITKAFLKLLGIALSALTGNPAFAVVGGAAPGGGTFSTPGGPVMAPPMPNAMAPAPAGGGGNTFIINTIESKSVLQSLASPTGAMRAANSRLVEIAAAS